jgi:hypothetical protein
LNIKVIDALLESINKSPKETAKTLNAAPNIPKQIPINQNFYL